MSETLFNLMANSSSSSSVSPLVSSLVEYAKGFELLKNWNEAVLTEKVRLWGNRSLAGAKASLRKDAELLAKGDSRVLGTLSPATRAIVEKGASEGSKAKPRVSKPKAKAKAKK